MQLSRKSFSFLALSGAVLLFCGAASAQTQNAPNLGAENMRAIAILGQSYGAMLGASGYRGHVVVSKVNFVPGQGTVAKVLNWQSAWQNGQNGQFARRWKDVSLVETKGGQSTTQKYSGLDDGELSKRFYPDKKAWSERPITRETDVSLNFVRAPLQMAVLLAAQGATLTATEEKLDGADVQIVRSGTTLEVVMDAKTLAMRNWKVTRRNGETETAVWQKNEMNPTFAPDQWSLKMPEGTPKVAHETVNMQLEF